MRIRLSRIEAAPPWRARCALALACAALAARAEPAPSGAPALERAAPTPPMMVAGGDGLGLWRGARPTPIISPSTRLGPADRARIPIAHLEPLDRAALAAEDAIFDSPDEPMRIGIGAALAPGANAGAWFTLPTGERLWVLDIACEGAIALRPRLTRMDLPPGASVSVSALDTSGAPVSTDGPWRGRGVWESGEMWASTAWAPHIRVECFVPPGAGAVAGTGAALAADDPPLIVSDAQRIYRGFGPVRVPGVGGVAPDGVVTDELPCHLDVTCFPAWSEVAKAVARYTVVNAASITVVCSGQLINTVALDLTPYFLTAKHCTDTVPISQSAEIFWLYQTPSCNGAPPDLASVPRSLGMTLIDAFSVSDYSLNIVQGALPPGIAWVGWDTMSLPTGTALGGVHHPGGSFKRFSMGAKAPAPVCRPESGFFGVNWSMGAVEPGSSGSGIFRDSTKSLVGQLFGQCEAASCANTFAVYGAFTRTHQVIGPWLLAGTDDALEPNDTCAAARAMNQGGTAGLILKSVDADWYAMSLPPGRRLRASIAFVNANGDIDLVAWGNCAAPDPLSASRTQGDLETVYAINPTTAPITIRLQVSMASSTRNMYSFGAAHEPLCIGDTNADQVVDFLDLNLVLGLYATTGLPPDVPGDVNFDGVVDFLDLNLVLGFYGATCAP